VNHLTKWRKSEGGVVGKYGDPRKALKPLSIVQGDELVNPAKQVFLVDPGSRLGNLKLRVIPKIDETQLHRLSADSYDAIGLTLVMRETGIKRFTQLGHWLLSDLPESIPLDEFPGLDRIVLDRITFSAGLTVLADRGDLELGRSLARKDFHINTESSGNQFPHRFVDPKYFVDQGLPRSTGWFVHILDEDGDKSAAETFEVYINKELANVASSKSADSMWATLAADTFSILILRLLKGDIPEEPIAGSILEQLKRQFHIHGMTTAQVSELVKSGENSRVLALAQAITKMTSILEAAL
jgi:hypothetical protein